MAFTFKHGLLDFCFVKFVFLFFYILYEKKKRDSVTPVNQSVYKINPLS